MSNRKKSTPLIDYQVRHRRRLFAGEITDVSEVHQFFAHFLEHQDAIRVELNQFTKQELSAGFLGGMADMSRKKKAMVASAWNRLAGTWHLADSVMVHWKQRFIDVWKEEIPKQTQADLEAFNQRQAEQRVEREAQRAYSRKCKENPVTLEEFRYHQDQWGTKDLSDFQLARFDMLRWDAYRRRLAKDGADLVNLKNGFDLGEVDAEIIETKHTKRGYDLFVVRFSHWLMRSDWLDVYQNCKELGGWYSGYDLDGAVPGLQFRTRAAAETFIRSLVDAPEGEDIAAVLAERQKIRQMGAAERLRFIAARQEVRAQEALEADRKTNTIRRAAMADAIEARSRALIAEAATIRALATILASTEHHPLDGVFHRNHLRTLAGIDAGNPDVRTAKIPRPWLWQRDCINIYLALEDTPGAKLAAAWILKQGEEKVVFPRGREEYAEKVVHFGQAPWYLIENMQTAQRLARMGLTEDWQLRHALRAYRQIKVPAEEQDALTRAVRQLIGTKIPGFFPTPPALVERVIDLADIEDGMEVLEPSAGKGDLAVAVREAGGQVTCVEVNARLCHILALQKLHPICMDFFQYQPEMLFDRVVMNPPFENKADLYFIQHAYSAVKPGGKLVAIAATSIQNYGSDFLEVTGATVSKNPPNAFRSAFRPTGVNTVTIVIERAEDTERAEGSTVIEDRVGAA